MPCIFRSVAQFGRAPYLGSGCHRFESCHSDLRASGTEYHSRLIPWEILGSTPRLRYWKYNKTRYCKFSLIQITEKRGTTLWVSIVMCGWRQMSEVGKRGLLDEKCVKSYTSLDCFLFFSMYNRHIQQTFCKYYVYRIFYKTKAAIRASHWFDIESCLWYNW